jgi:hypothetical protein
VTVNADQAVVAETIINGRQEEGGGSDAPKSRQPHALAHAPVASVLGEIEADRVPVPRAGGERP